MTDTHPNADLPETSDAKAQAIYQHLLDKIAETYFAGDFDGFARMIHVPHRIEYFAKAVVLKTRDDLRRLFDDICNHNTQNGITNIIRTCLAAQFLSKDEILGMHETRMIMTNQVMLSPYPVKSVLRRIDGAWWVCESDNALEPDEGLGQVLDRYTSTRKPPASKT